MRIYLLRTNYFNVHLSVEKNILLLFLQLNFKYLINNLQTQMEKWRQPHSQGSGTLQKPSHNEQSLGNKEKKMASWQMATVF